MLAAVLLLKAAPLRVLFVGNGYAFFNNLPVRVYRVVEATPGRRIETDGVTLRATVRAARSPIAREGAPPPSAVEFPCP